MKRTPTPRAVCARPDCTTESRQGGWCSKHDAQVRRTGSPYRRDELDDRQSGNQWTNQMDEVLQANPPEITWAPNGKGIMIAVEVHDPHGDSPRRIADPFPFGGSPMKGAGVAR